MEKMYLIVSLTKLYNMKVMQLQFQTLSSTLFKIQQLITAIEAFPRISSTHTDPVLNS